MSVKIIDENVKIKIYDMFNDENVTKTALAKEFDCSRRTIGRSIEEVENNITHGVINMMERLMGDVPDPVTDELTLKNLIVKEIKNRDKKSMSDDEFNTFYETEKITGSIGGDENFDNLKDSFQNLNKNAIETDEDFDNLVKESYKQVYTYVMTQDSITLYCDGEAFSVSESHEKFDEIKRLIVDEKFEDVLRIMDVKAVLVSLSDRVKIDGNELFIDENCIDGSLIDKIMNDYNDDDSIDRYVKFFEKCYDNPSIENVDTIYRFVNDNSIKIDDDGNVIAYKVIRENYMDKNSGKFDNSIGQIPEMDRKKVDHNNKETCSTGLHVCAFSYVSSFIDEGDKVVICKVSPYDICSVPYDYNDAKCRCCKYEVISEVY